MQVVGCAKKRQTRTTVARTPPRDRDLSVAREKERKEEERNALIP